MVNRLDFAFLLQTLLNTAETAFSQIRHFIQGQPLLMCGCNHDQVLITPLLNVHVLVAFILLVPQ